MCELEFFLCFVSFILNIIISVGMIWVLFSLLIFKVIARSKQLGCAGIGLDIMKAVDTS